MKILLGSLASVNSTNTDSQIGINFKNSQMLFSEDILYNIIDETIQFQTERNNCYNYLVYGKIESLIDDTLSFTDYQLNNTNYTVELGYISHLIPDSSSLIAFTIISGTTINIADASLFTQNDVVLVYQNKDTFYFSKILDLSGNTMILDIDETLLVSGFNLVPASALYSRNFTPLYSNNFLIYYPSSFSTNIFSSEITQYHTNKIINISGLTDNFNFPLTDLILRFTLNNNNIINYLNLSGNTVSDVTIMDYVIYDLNTLSLTVVDSVNHKFNNVIDYFYNPYSVQPIRKFSTSITNASTNTLFDYPSYAIIFNSGDVLYNTYLDVGYFEEGTNGIDYPYINNLNYIYSDNKFTIRRIIPIADYSSMAVADDSTIAFDNAAVNQIPTGGLRLC